MKGVYTVGKIGIIGGSGLYDIEGFSKVKHVNVSTPFGKPSDTFVVGILEGRQVVFLPRHGRGHRLNPSEVNYRANIYAMKKLGVDRIISVTACGSLREDLKPLDFVLPDQFVDRTNQARCMTFFEKGAVAHVSFSDPVCEALRQSIYKATKEAKVPVHLGGTYLNMEGPAFSTRAESNLYRSWGMDIIGMTNISEAKLAREAEICYATLAAITDYDCWFKPEEQVNAELVIQNLIKNVENAKIIIKKALRNIAQERSCACAAALQHAIVTDKRTIAPAVKKRLKVIAGNYLS
ncbi:MAG TPA: S-methyl-5'-thioadenosine phosphorylase [Candidatus Omnitrophota bacterium]|nr:S-methyl-5'-thioadenosine phosphorylase [Candidatus Omnitrophota bacterium]HRZ15260.1 S-methyl-5'-thioadenosine phosphorylase [Candidatus Omnitrophota bacterium]